MAVNDTVAAQSAVAAGASLDIRPGTGTRWLVQSIWASGACQLKRVSGANEVVLEAPTAAKWWQGLVERVTDTVFLRVTNTGASAIDVGYAGVEVP